MSDRSARWLRFLWVLLFGLSVLTVVVSTLYAVRASYAIQPVVTSFGLDFEVSSDGELTVGTWSPLGEAREVPPTAKVVAVNGKPVDGDIQIAEFADLLDKSPGKTATVTIRQPDGRTITLNRTRNNALIAGEWERDVRIWARLLLALLACTALLACSVLLALRRPNDPVAMMLAFAFTIIVASIDPPMQFWLWTNQDMVIDVLGGFFFYLMLVGLAAFPDGVFVPRFLRWLIPGALVLAILASIPGVDEDLQGLIGVGALFAVVAAQFIRFRREPPGIARQQIKWAGFGFAAGLTLVMGALVLAATYPDDPAKQSPFVALIIILLFSAGMATMALGLLTALTRFRLWEADTVITRSAAYAVVTLIVGVVWAASSDLVKLVITEVMGRESEAGATTVGAIIAAGVFSPTQSAVLGWTRRHFGGPLDQIRDAAKRLKTWGLTEAPEEVATRALAIIDQAVHPNAAAIVLDTAMSHELIAARDVVSAEDPKLIEKLTLADEETSVGTLLIGRRSDGNRYNRQELEAIREIIPSLAEALRVSRGRFSRESAMQQRMEEMAARLAQLEGGAPKPA